MLTNRRIFASTKLMGLIGQNIDYSLSPAIHNAAALELRRDHVYLNIDLQTDNLEQLLHNMWNIGAFGFNLTTPFKEDAAKILKSELISINTIYRGLDSWKATSTDYIGFKNAIFHELKPLSEYNKIVFFGFGGASKSILEGMIRSNEWKDKSVEIYNRTQIPGFVFERLGIAPSLAKNFSDFGDTCSESLLQDSLLIQSIPSAYLAGVDEPKISFLQAFPGTVFDLNYAGLHNYFFKRLNHNLPTADGLSMLIYQALESQKIWWGRSIAFEQALDAIKDSGLLNRLTTA